MVKPHTYADRLHGLSINLPPHCASHSHNLKPSMRRGRALILKGPFQLVQREARKPREAPSVVPRPPRQLQEIIRIVHEPFHSARDRSTVRRFNASRTDYSNIPESRGHSFARGAVGD